MAKPNGMWNGEYHATLAERLGSGPEEVPGEPTAPESEHSLWIPEEPAERRPELELVVEPVSSLPRPEPAASLREGLRTAEERAHRIAEEIARVQSELRLTLDAGLAEAAPAARSFPRLPVPRLSRRLVVGLLVMLAVLVSWEVGLLWTDKVENFVVDSGYERTSVPWYPAGHHTEVSRMAGRGRGGSAALEVHTQGAADGEGPGYLNVSGIQQGKRHSFSAYARSLGGATVYAEIRWKASDGSFVEASRGASHRLGASWQRVVASGVAPEGAASALLVVGEAAGTPGRVGYQIDDAQFEQASDAGTYVATDGRTGVLPAHPTDVAALLMLVAAALFALTSLRLVVLVAIPLSLLVPASITTVGSSLPDMTPTRALVLASFCVLLARRQLRFPPRRVTVPAIVYVAAVGAAVLLQPSVHAGVQALSVTLGAWAPALLVLGVARRPRDLWLLSAVLSGVATVAAGLALFEMATGHYLLGEDPGLIFRVLERSGTLRTQATFPHPILLGTFVALALPLLVALAVRRGGWSRAGWLVAFLLGVAGLSSTLSRGPWLAAAAGLTVFLVLSGLRRRWIYLAAALSALGLAAALPVATPVRHAAVGAVTRSGWQDRYIVDFRLQQAGALARYAVANPFSAHLDAASRPRLPGVVEGREINNAAQLDSIYGNELIQTGIFGLLAYLATVAMAISVVFRSSRWARGELRVLGSALFAACIVALVVGLFSNVLGFAQVGTAFWLAIGAGICLGSLAQGGDERSEVADAGD
jgi:hypothetical protein